MSVLWSLCKFTTCNLTIYVFTSSDADYAKTIERMWLKPLSVERLPYIARDVARLVGRTQVDIHEFTSMKVQTGSEPHLYRVAHQIATAFSPDEVSKVTLAIESASGVHNNNPDQGFATAALMEACGRDNSPTVRVLKLLHQKYVLEACCGLQLGNGPLAGIYCKDVAGPDGWRIIIDRNVSNGGLRVIHLRESRLSVGMNLSNTPTSAETEPRVSWQLTVELDATASTVNYVSCVVHDLICSATTNIDPAIAKLHKRIQIEGPIHIF